ncbi:hypothetical protein M501DRAFT_1005161 [Patellaria atrata CBS 101060]|uniref:Uncharacterized protein n=1 Tax=Patellaria atrata CBS 101060 TaxID=1346257 RepID=A0A9P4S9E7_9PEZI|nr:hypothetical protein M501DRAFT_1005161 [Patellaria atrata CBS 101060]
MAIPSPSFIAGVVILLYLSSFVVFALIRIITGISIQRVGIQGFRRISYTPKDGFRIDIRGIGLSLHRPTFAQPTWVSIVLTELKVTVDLKALARKTDKKPHWHNWANGSPEHQSVLRDKKGPVEDEHKDSDEPEDIPRSKTWKQLTEVKEKIKRLHRKIQWIRLIDLVSTNSTFVISEVGSVQVVNFTMAVDTRRKTVDRSRLFQHRRSKSEQRPAEWIFTVRSILFTPEGNDSTEILDHCTLNVHGLLYTDLEGLRDASIALKLGRLSIPYDDIHLCMEQIKQRRAIYGRRGPESSTGGISFADVVGELDRPGSREENIVQTVSDSREFVSSILRGIQEIQFAVSFFGLTKRIGAMETADPVYLNIAMKELGMDLLRLDPQSPAHVMYFSRDDIAHQALIAAIAISVGIDDGQDHPERLLYIPMATTTMKTTLPSKTIQFSDGKNVAERNANILFANLVVTSPSLDLDPGHLPLVLALLQSHQDRPVSTTRSKRKLISRLLPKASIKISIHEPVIRVSLPCMDPNKRDDGQYDLLISAMSSISLDVESSHSAGEELHYSLVSNLRVLSHQLYYQTDAREKHNLLLTDSLEVKLEITASPDVAVYASANLQTFSLYLVRPEISEGVRLIVAQLRRDTPKAKLAQADRLKVNFLRKLPAWLLHVHLQGSDFNVDVAGIDFAVSPHARGCQLHLESWDAEYKADKNDVTMTPVSRRRVSRSIQRDDAFIGSKSPTSPRRIPGSVSDGRRLAIHTQGLEGFVIESADNFEPESFVSLPRFEVAFSTSTDKQGPVFHINSYAKEVFFHYSLYRHFAIGVATMVLRKTFQRPPGSPSSSESSSRSTSQFFLPNSSEVGPGREILLKRELTSYDFKAGFVQIKATMPSGPPVMVHIHGLEAGQHRWSAPFARAQLMRLYAETPRLKRFWSRLVTLKGPRLDFRQSRRKQGLSFVEDNSMDLAADAIRIGVPHQLVVHTIIDNLVNTAKTIEQLHHRFRTETDVDILEKKSEGPKRVPKISVRTHALLFEIEDGSFEWKLGAIYRLGLLEQKQRIAREEMFKLKVRKMREYERGRGSSRFRAKSTNNVRDRNRGRNPEVSKRRSQSSDSCSTTRSRPSRSRGRKMRYDVEGICGLGTSAKRTVQQAWDKLQQLNAQSWKKRIDHGLKSQNRAMKDIRSIFWGIDELPDDVEHNENILAVPQRPALVAVVVSDVNILIDKPSFPLSEYSKYLHRVGKGIPHDTQYSLLVPMNIQISMGECRITLRDYPLPLIHVPAIRPGQHPRSPSLSLKTDFVIAEEYRNTESMRHAQIVVVPPGLDESGQKSAGLQVTVSRTVSPVKTYSDMKVEINTSYPTRITWGTSYQPAIQDMMQVIEAFTKPAIDPSERVGFWDKIRLTFHSKINVAWKGDGDVHLILKGSRDPYMVTGQGAGFVMCWRNDVRWNIAQEDDPRKFMTVNSGSYILAIPDLTHYARHSYDTESSDFHSSSSTSSFRSGATFLKTIMKLSGKVQWLAGLVFERNLDNGGRSFDFTPHYNVVLKNPRHAECTDGKGYDAFRGFRSHHIHMSVAIAAPVDKDWSSPVVRESSNYNSVHLTPRFFSHFFSWWSMFSGAMALPIRQGKLFPGVEKSSKKFGRHLATIKYNILLSPLFMSHIYKHKDPEEYSQSTVSATGLKIRLDSFIFDLHQRREEFKTMNQGSDKESRATGMRINQAQVDFISADIRAVSASIAGTNPADLDVETDDTIAFYQQPAPAADLSRFTIPDNDFSWVDMDDFVELDWILPAESNPETQILPLAYSPRFTYFRQTDHQDITHGDPNRSSPFGNEPTHYCVMSARNDPRRVQIGLVKERLSKIEEQMSHNRTTLGELELQMIRESQEDPKKREHADLLESHNSTLHKKKAFLQNMLQTLKDRLESGNGRAVPEIDAEEDMFFEAKEEYDPTDQDISGMDSAPLQDYIDDFNNRFIVHNAQLKWNNPLRNIILRYIHQVSQRRGFVYYMSRRAVKFILDIVEEQNKAKHGPPAPDSQPVSQTISPTCANGDDKLNVQDRVQQLLDDGKKFVNADDPEDVEGDKPSPADIGKDISQEFTPQNTYHVRLIGPQIQLQSEKNTKSAVLVTAKGIQLKVVQIMDKDRVTDDVSGLVQRRFSATMDSLQIFVTSTKTFSTEYLHMYTGNRWGTPAGSLWPPWVPMEVMYIFDTNPYGFSRVVRRTSASLRYDKYNTLRLKYNDDVTNTNSGHASCPDNAENRIDHLWVDFPHVRAICDSTQYFAMYIIVLDLLLYNEPLEKTRSERLEKIMLASDFSDLTGAPELVITLQERIRQLEEIKMHFQVNERYLDRQGWKDRVVMERELATCEDELFFMMKAITTSQRKIEDRGQSAQSNGLLRWNIGAQEIVWHLVREGNESLVELQLKNALYDRTDNNDGSNFNSVEIDRIHGLNLLPNATYPEMITPYFDGSMPYHESRDAKMLKVHWYMLEAIGGIPVLEHFEVNLFPLKIQLEREVGKKLFEYIFPGISSNAFEGGTFSPFMIRHMLPAQEEEDEEDSALTNSQLSSTNSNWNSTDSSHASLELRLQPTLNLPASRSKISPSKNRLGSRVGRGESHFRLFAGQPHRADSEISHSSRSGLVGADSSSLKPASKPPSMRSNSVLSSSKSSDTEKPKRFGLNRPASKDRKEKENTVRSDDLTQMMTRASNYMTLAYVKIPTMVLCLSYKGKGQRNVEDVHDLVFRMPTLEYRNKTWSNLDLALQLKKDVIKALISHTGAIIGNKFSQHRPTRQQQSRLREIANSSTLLHTSNDTSNTASETSSTFEASPIDGLDTEQPRRSFASGRGSVISRTGSQTSSTHSGNATSWGGSPHLGGSEGSSILPAMHPQDEDGHGNPGMRTSLSRHLTGLSHKSNNRSTTPTDEPEELSARRKSKLLLGKKFLQSLPRT